MKGERGVFQEVDDEEVLLLNCIYSSYLSVDSIV